MIFQSLLESVDSSRLVDQIHRVFLNHIIQIVLKRGFLFLLSFQIFILFYSEIFSALSLIQNLPKSFLLFPHPSKTPKSHHLPSILLKTLKPPNYLTLNHFLSSPHQIQSNMAPKACSKRKGKEPMRDESPPHYYHSSYLS